LVAHRCGGGEAPENTLAAARRCHEQGVEYIEVDVRTSRDKTLMVIHDASVTRTTNGKGRVRDHDAAELGALDAGSWHGEEFAGEPVPTLEDLLRWAKGKIRVYIDVKDADPQSLVDVLRRTGMVDQCFVGFKRRSQVEQFTRLAPGVALKQSIESLHDLRHADEVLGAKVVEIKPKHLSPELVRACRERGVRVMIPVFDRDDELYVDAMRWGPDLINLDHPGHFRGLFSGDL
jgi:glycerophosphoryl diester phosphodiesterase